MKRSDTPGRKKIRGQWVWVASKNARMAGFVPRTQRLPAAEDTHPATCQRLWAEMLDWISAGQLRSAVFDGTIAGLAKVYQTIDVSPFKSVEPATQSAYSRVLAAICSNVGERRIDALTGIDFRRWHAKWAEPKEDGGKVRIRSAQEHMKLLRIIFNFGAEQRLKGCATAADILSRIEFAAPKPRTTSMTRTQAEAIIETAMAGDKASRSIALAQAIQFEFAIRQSDVIGTWRPRTRMMAVTPGMIVAGASYWNDGLTWESIDAGALTVRPHKGNTGKILTFDIALAPLMSRVLAVIPDVERQGPMIVDNGGLPFRRDHFSKRWRRIASRAGIPADVWNRDSRSGAISETTDYAEIEDARHVAGHSNTAMTARYSREPERKIRRAQQARADGISGGKPK